MLAMHYRRSALFVVADSIDLLDAAWAVANDDQASVKAWIDNGDLVRPTEAQVEVWQDEEGAQFRSVIVQPFVLAQRASDE